MPVKSILIEVVPAVFFLLAALFLWLRLRACKAQAGFIEKVVSHLAATSAPSTFDELQSVLSYAAGAFREYSGAGWAAVARVNREDDAIELLTSTCSPTDAERLKRTLKEDWRNTCSGHAVLQQKSVLLANRKKFPNLQKELDAASGLFIPLIENGNAFGVFLAGDGRPGVFTREEMKMGQMIAWLLGPFTRGILAVLRQKRLAAGPGEPEVLQDLEVARILQRKLIPPQLPEVEGVEMAARLMPAKEVSGDFYDCFLLREKTLAVNIGDVSGKSIPAALLVSMAKYIFRFPPSLYIRPSKLMDLANKIVYMNGGGFFITDCFATLELGRNQFVYVNAGHPPVLHYRARDNQVGFLPPTGALLGVAEDSRYREETVSLSRGDILLFYSDGLTEIKLDRKRTLGEEGLAAIFQKLTKLTMEKLIDDLLAEILRLYGAYEQKRDDISCVALKISG